MRNRGAVLPLIAILLPVLLVLAGLAINIAYIQLASTQLQISTDVAAKAAGREFAINRNSETALLVANQFGALNQVAGKPLVFQAEDLRVGTASLVSAGSRYQFQLAETSISVETEEADDAEEGGLPALPLNALEVIGNRTTGSAHGEIKTYFPNLVGKTSFGLSTTSVSTQVEVDIALVLDRSGSMAYADNELAVYPPIPAAAPEDWYFGDQAPANARWRDAVAASTTLLDDLASSPLDEQVALITYSDTARIDQGLTSSYQLVKDQLDVYTQALTGGGTNIGAGLQAAQAELASSNSRPFAAKVVIILTDGQRTVGESPTGWASNLADDGVMVVTVTFSAEADQSLMKRVAAAGNGFHVHATNQTDLMNAFQYIVRRLPTLLTR